MSTQKANGKGFTIIEVVLVLAIAGLIFLVVFLALPALQRGQRDQQRKSDLSRFMSQIVAYQSNNQGFLPGQTATVQPNSAAFVTFIGNYLTNSNQTFSDPQTNATYVPTYANAAPAAAPTLTAGQILVYGNSKCGGANGAQTATGNRNIAVLIFQEQGGFSCQSN